ncbi:MAG: hypothetical protein AABY22_09690 [Nanoarchaeota archaeon]
MSGGHFDYQDMRIQDIIDQLERDEKKYPTKDLQILTRSVMNILHAYDWFMSGDTSQDEFEAIYDENIRELMKELKE